MKILHFSDAHIGATGMGKRDPQTDLPVRVMDYLKSLDAIADYAVRARVDLVLFCGDAFHHRQPSPTMQREWGRRIMRISQAGIPSVLLVGNHDLSPALNRAHALDGFQTFNVPNVIVIDRPTFLGPAELGGLPLQVIALPYITRSGMMAAFGLSGGEPEAVYKALSEKVGELVRSMLDERDVLLPTVLAAHMTVEGASIGGFRTMVLGKEASLEPALVRDPRLAYVALGHIHKPQDMNPGSQPPVVYPGSIERLDFGEAAEKKYFVVAEITPGEETRLEWIELPVRPFIDRRVLLTKAENALDTLLAALPGGGEMDGAKVRLVVEYPRDLEAIIDEQALAEAAASAFEFHLVRRPILETRIRIPEDQTIGSLSPQDLLEKYLGDTSLGEKETKEILGLAAAVIQDVSETPVATG